jgi:isoquinoline 1-oxidoreductase beta subunit
VPRLPYGVGVLAETPWSALRPREALARSVTWTRLGTAWGDSDKGMEAFAAAARATSRRRRPTGTNRATPGAMANSATTIDATYRCDYAYHAQMEPLNAIASVSSAATRSNWCGHPEPEPRGRGDGKCSASRATR